MSVDKNVDDSGREVFFNKMQRIAKIGSWELDLITNDLYWSDEVYRIFELKPQEFKATYDDFLDKIHPDDRLFVDEAYKKSVENKKPYNIIHRILLKDESVKYVRERCETEYDSSGKSVNSVGTIQDITETILLENKLKKSEKDYRNLVTHSSQMFYTHDANHVISYVSHQSKKIFGYTPEEMKVNWTTLITDNPINEEGYKKTETALRTGEIQEPYLLHFKNKNGNTFWAEIHEAPIKNENDEVVGMTGALTDVTKRKEAEDRLRENEEKMRMIYEKSPDAIYIYDFMGRFVDGNKAAEKMVGGDRDGFIGKSFLEMNLLSKKDIAKSIKGIAKVKMGEETGIEEYSLNSLSGRPVDIETRSFPIKIGEKNLIMGIARDVTNFKKATSEVEEMQAEFKSLYENINEGVVFHELVKDGDGKEINYRILKTNPEFEVQTGIKRDDVEGKLATEAYGVDKPPYFDEYLKMIESGKSTSFESYFPPLNKHFSISAVYTNKDGFITVFSDITSQKIREMELEKFKLGLDRINEAVFVTDKDGIFEYVNPAFEKMYGYSKQEWRGKTPRILKSGKSDEEFYRKFWRSLLSDKTIHIELVNKKKNGDLIEIMASAGSILDKEGGVVGFLAVQRDVTDEKNKDRELQEKMDDLEKINKLMVGRELKMAGLKEKIVKLRRENKRSLVGVSGEAGKPLNEKGIDEK